MPNKMNVGVGRRRVHIAAGTLNINTKPAVRSTLVSLENSAAPSYGYFFLRERHPMGFTL